MSGTMFWTGELRGRRFPPGGLECVVKLLTEYLERAVQLEELADKEPDSSFKDQLLTQAQAYRKLAAKRAEDLGMPPPSLKAE
jgi:hypothetical protein